MRFEECHLKGAFVIDPTRAEDNRGFYARTFCRKEFIAHGIDTAVAEGGIAFNPVSGTLRGMHLQKPPFTQAKLIRCTMGAIHDVIIDLRPESPTFKQHIAVTLTAINRRMLFVPKGFAHGYITLEDNTEVSYQMSDDYAADHAIGVRWNDPAFGISWPTAVRVIADRDNNYPDFKT